MDTYDVDWELNEFFPLWIITLPPIPCSGCRVQLRLTGCWVCCFAILGSPKETLK